MGRSVGTASGSVAVAYTQFGEDGEYVDAHDWDDMVVGFQESIAERWPSFEPADEWHDREGRVIAGNTFAQVVVYEYCGLVALCLIPHPKHDNEEYAAAWCERIKHRFVQRLGTLRKIGTASNGESFFEQVPRRTPTH